MIRSLNKKPDTREKAKHRVLSLFSGAGGLDLGFHLQGQFRVELGNEILTPAATTYSNNFKAKLVEVDKFKGDSDLPAIVGGDVAHLDLTGLSESFQVLAGGPPCQDFSIVRGPQVERPGITVKRGNLYTHFVKALDAIQPPVFLFENVPGLITTNSGIAYRTILEDFSDLPSEAIGLLSYAPSINLGYDILFKGPVRFKDLGVPQDRRRLIIIGARRDLVRRMDEATSQRLRLRASIALSGKQELFHAYPLTPLEVFEGRTLVGLDQRYREIMLDYKGIWNQVKTPNALRWREERWESLTFDIVKDYAAENKIESFSRDAFDRAMRQHELLLRELGYWGVDVANVDGGKIPPNGNGVKNRMRMIPPDANHEFVRGTEWEVEGRGMSLIYRRIHPLKPAYTVVAYGGGGTWSYHYDRSRATLSTRERARLQTFPDSFTFHGTESQVRAQIGEAVPPLAAKRMAGVIADILPEILSSKAIPAYA